MNYKSKTLLLLSALMVASAPMTVDAAETKEQREARIKAEQKEREIKQANMAEFNKTAREFYDSFQRDSAAAMKAMDKILAMVGKPGIDTQRVYGFHNNLKNTEIAAELKTYLKGFYEKMLTKTTGDLKIQNLQDYADFLKKNKMADQDKINAILKQRYSVKDVSPRKMVEILAADLELEKADAAAQKWLNEQKDNKGKISVASTLARNIFSKHKVYGSKFANKYAGIWMELLKEEGSPSAKIQAIHWYAPYARDYALISDAEYSKLMASRYTIKDLSSSDLNSIYCHDIKQENGTLESEALMKKAIAAAKTAGERANVYLALSRTIHNTPVFEFLPAVMENKALADEELYTKREQQNNLRHLLSNYVNRCTATRYTESNKFMNALAVKAKTRIAPAEVAAKAAEADLKKFEFGTFKTMKDRAQANNLLNEKRNEVRKTATQLEVVRNSAVQVYAWLHELNKKFADRYYAPSNPVELKRAIAAKEQIIAILPDKDVRGKALHLRDIIFLAYDAKDYALVKKIAKEILSNKAPELEKDNTAKIWATYALGFTAYDEEAYSDAVKYLQPMTYRNDHVFKDRLYEKLVRSYVALGEYEEALKYTDAMVKNARYYMRARLEQQVQELKERAEEAKKKQN